MESGTHRKIDSAILLKRRAGYFLMSFWRGRGCILIAQLETAFVKSKLYLFKMAPWSSPKMHGTLQIKTEKRNQFTQQEIRGNNRQGS